PTTRPPAAPRALQPPEHRARAGDGTPAASVLAEVHVREAHSRWLGEPLSMPLQVLLELRLRRQIALPHPTRREPHHLDQGGAVAGLARTGAGLRDGRARGLLVGRPPARPDALSARGLRSGGGGRADQA